MTAIAVTRCRLTCDESGCQQAFTGESASFFTVRRAAKKRGWEWISGTMKTFDLCPTHSSRRPESEESS